MKHLPRVALLARSATHRPMRCSNRMFSTTLRRDTNYGFIGLGKMGYPMARNLRTKLPKDDTLFICDINKAATERFCKEMGAGVEVSSDVGEVVERSELIITMLPEPSHVWSVFSRLASAPPPRLASNAKRLFIDSSTIDVATSLSIAELIADAPDLNGAFVDAPVSGGVAGATAGTLTFMLGCPNSLLSRANDVLSLMGSRIFHCGKPGSGLAAKLTNNYLLAISNIATAEAMNMGLTLGLDKDVLKNVINSSSGKCWSSDVNNPVDNALKDFEGGFAVALMKKDLALAMRTAHENGAKLVMAEKAESVYNDLSRKDGQKDFSIVFKWLQESSG